MELQITLFYAMAESGVPYKWPCYGPILNLVSHSARRKV